MYTDKCCFGPNFLSLDRNRDSFVKEVKAPLFIIFTLLRIRVTETRAEIE